MSYPVRELFERQAKTPAAINVATYVGHGDLRDAVMGKDFKRHATPAEVARMKAMVTEGMEAGALGLATGLEYDPGINSDTGEIIELAKEAARFGGRYISHVRSEDRWFWAAIDEIVRIGREAKIPVQVSHMKLAMVDWWGQSKRLLDILDKARADGVDITADVYPYEYWHSTLTVLFPDRDYTQPRHGRVRPEEHRARGRPADLRVFAGSVAGRANDRRDRPRDGQGRGDHADGAHRAFAGGRRVGRRDRHQHARG